MKPASRRLQFGLRRMLIGVTLVGLYLAWRMHDPERSAIQAIRAAGGKVHFGYQMPFTSSTFFSVAMLPEYHYFSFVEVSDHGTTDPPALTAREILFRPGSEHQVRLVELKLNDFTPELAETLQSLSELREVVVEMPSGMLPRDSPAGKKLAALQELLPGKVYPVVRREE
jgi:hypothetical protein